MTNRRKEVPEPEQQKKEDSDSLPSTGAPAWSSEETDDSADEEAAFDHSGYQQLTLSENDAGVAEFHLEPMLSSDDDAETDDVTPSAEFNNVEEHRREMNINSELVMKALEGITLPGTSVPPWAKELSDLEWTEVIDRTIRDGNSLPARPDKKSNVDDANGGLS